MQRTERTITLFLFLLCSLLIAETKAQTVSCLEVNKKQLVIGADKNVLVGNKALAGKSKQEILAVLGLREAELINENAKTLTWFYSPQFCDTKKYSDFALRILFKADTATEAVLIIATTINTD